MKLAIVIETNEQDDHVVIEELHLSRMGQELVEIHLSQGIVVEARINHVKEA